MARENLKFELIFLLFFFFARPLIVAQMSRRARYKYFRTGSITCRKEANVQNRNKKHNKQDDNTHKGHR
jgi:hypothetical protein